MTKPRLIKIWSGVGYLIISPDLRATVPGPIFLPAYNQSPQLLNLIFWGEALVGILGLVVVPALSRLVKDKEEGWVTWTSNLAIVGFAVTAIGYILTLARLPGIAKAFVAGEAATKAALAVTWKSSPDLFGFWGYGAIGIWVLCLSLLFLRHHIFPNLLNILGLVVAVLYFLIPLGTYYKVQALILAAAGGGLVAGPLWYIWIGLMLRRRPITE